MRAWLRGSEEGAAHLGQASDPKNDAPPRIPKPRNTRKKLPNISGLSNRSSFFYVPSPMRNLCGAIWRDTYDRPVKPFKNVTMAPIVEIFKM